MYLKMLDISKKPIIILGGGGWTNNANSKAEKALKIGVFLSSLHLGASIYIITI